MGGDLNEVAVPTYLVRSAVNCLKALCDVCARRDMAQTISAGLSVARSLGMLEDQQSFPRGSRIVAKEVLSGVPIRTFGGAARIEAFQKLYKDKVLKAFQKLDVEAKGKGRFHLILTYTEA